MPTIDEFESRFRRAIKPLYDYEEISISSVVLVLDGKAISDEDLENIKRCTKAIFGLNDPDLRIETFNISEFTSVVDCIRNIRALNPDLIISERLLGLPDTTLPSIGAYVDSFSYRVDCPVCIVPFNFLKRNYEKCEALKNIMVLSESIQGDSKLVNFALNFVSIGTKLVLTDMINGKTFNYYIELVSKIASIETEPAREELQKLIVKMASEFEDDCITKLEEIMPDLAVAKHIDFAYKVQDYLNILNEHKADILIINSRTDEEKNLNTIAHSLAISVTDIPVMLI